jgi:hypothetical protein
MINNYRQLVVFLFVVFCFAACTQERLPCPQPTIMSVIIGCHQVIALDTLGNPIIGDTTFSNPEIVGQDSAGFWVTGTKYPLGSKQLLAHLSPIVDSCKWVVSPDTVSYVAGITDTITFHYQHQLNFLSNACGYAYFYNLQSVSATHTFIDSATIINASVNTNINTEHVKIYIHKHP